MSRKPILDKPMTSAERTRRHRAKIKESSPDLKACLKKIELLTLENEKLKAVSAEWEFNAMLAEYELQGKKRGRWKDADFARFANLFNHQNQITKEELNVLRQVCHPDKHGQSPISVKATVILNRVAAEMN